MGRSKSPKIPKIETKPIEVVEKIEDLASEEAQRQRRLSYLAAGYPSNMLYGIIQRLKGRLGE